MALDRRWMVDTALRRSTESGVAHELHFELGLPAQLVDQVGHRIAAIAGLHQQVEPEAIGLQPLLA